jgi:putative transposase
MDTLPASSRPVYYGAMGEYRRGSHCLYQCDYHIVITTKYRRKIINAGMGAYLEGKLFEINEHYPAIFFKTMNHDKDHVHLLASIPPPMSVGSVIRIIKSNTARKIKERFAFLRQVYGGTDGIWSDGYFVSTAGIPPGIIERYIENQGREDAGQTAKLFE